MQKLRWDKILCNEIRKEKSKLCVGFSFSHLLAQNCIQSQTLYDGRCLYIVSIIFLINFRCTSLGATVFCDIIKPKNVSHTFGGNFRCTSLGATVCLVTPKSMIMHADGIGSCTLGALSCPWQ